jgi:hypothetical protein
MYWFILFFLTSKSCCLCTNWSAMMLTSVLLSVRKQIQHMIKYRYVPFSFGKTRYNRNSQ